jgi:hypothetical protein
MPQAKYDNPKDELIGLRDTRKALNDYWSGDIEQAIDGIRPALQQLRADVRHPASGDPVPNTDQRVNDNQRDLRTANFPTTEADQINTLRKSLLDSFQLLEQMHAVMEQMFEHTKLERRVVIDRVLVPDIENLREDV